MASTNIRATDGSGSFEAFVFEPKHKPAGALVLIQEIFGVNESLKETARWYADLGLITIVPDLFWRIKPGIVLTDKSQEEFDQALAYMKQFDQEKGVEDIKATLAAVRRHPGCNGKAGTAGYCLGGRLAVMMALHSDSDVNISYYGVGLDNLIGDFGRIHAPLMMHIADQDGFFPPEGRAKVVEAAKGHPHATAYVYPEADHAFARVHGVHWHGLSAAIANGRTAEALAEVLIVRGKGKGQRR